MELTGSSDNSHYYCLPFFRALVIRMALVHESIGDFVLFPRDQAYCDPRSTDFRQGFAGFDSDHANTIAMQQQYPHPGIASFDHSSSMPVYSSGQSNYYNATDFLFDGSKDHTRPYQQRQTPSGSVSPSLPQSLDHPPSTLSSTSGASGQSTTSSTVGSPYSLATHSLPGQDTWADLNQGLGIAPDIIHNDGFPQDPFPSGGLENEFCFQTGKFSDSFVGECGRFSSVPPSQYFPNAQGLYDARYVSPSPYSAPLQAQQGSMAAFVKPSDSFPSVRQPHRLSISRERIEIPGSPPTRTDTMSPSKEKFRQPANSASVPVVDQLGPAQQHAAFPSQNHYYRAPNFMSNRSSNGNFVAPLSSSCRFSLPVLLCFFHSFSRKCRLSSSSRCAVIQEC